MDSLVYVRNEEGRGNSFGDFLFVLFSISRLVSLIINPEN